VPQPYGATFLHPTAVLFNGGVLKSGLLAERVLAVLNGWLAADGAEPARVCSTAPTWIWRSRAARPITAMCGAAVACASVAARRSPTMSASSRRCRRCPGIEPPLQALCLAPFGMEEGTEAPLPEQEFGLVVGEPVRFRFFGSTVRRQDQVGTLLDFWGPDELQELQEIEVTCRPRVALPARWSRCDCTRA
jgi:hypothetical protein